MAKYRVSFNGWYVIKADTEEEALKTSADDFDVEFAEWENADVEELEADNG